MKDLVCELCQRSYGSSEAFYQHLDEHTRKEVEELRRIAYIQLSLEGEALETFNWTCTLDWLRKGGNKR